MDARAEPAFHRLEVDLGQLHAAAGDELILEGALAVDREAPIDELGDERLQRGVGDMRPRSRGRDAGGGDEFLPESLGEWHRAEGADLLAGFGLAEVRELGEDGLAFGAGHPVDRDLATVAAVSELAGAPGGELEDGGSAQAPVGDEQRAVGAELGARERRLDVLHGDAGDVGQPRVLDVEGEERGDGWDDGVAEGFGDRQAAGGLVATRGDDQPVAEQGLARAQRQLQAERGPFDRADRGLDADVDAGAPGGAEQAVRDRRGVVGDREHAAIRLGLRGHAAGGEPGDGVAGLEAVEGAEQFAAAAGVAFHQLRRLEAGMGDVATAAAGDLDLREQVGRRLEERDLPAAAQSLRAGDRREEAGGSSSDDGDVAAGWHRRPLSSRRATGYRAQSGLHRSRGMLRRQGGGRSRDGRGATPSRPWLVKAGST